MHTTNPRVPTRTDESGIEAMRIVHIAYGPESIEMILRRPLNAWAGARWRIPDYSANARCSASFGRPVRPFLARTTSSIYISLHNTTGCQLGSLTGLLILSQLYTLQSATNTNPAMPSYS